MLISLCIAPLLLLALYLAIAGVRDAHVGIHDRAADLAGDFATILDQNLDARIHALSMLANSPHARERDWGQLYGDALFFREQFGTDVVLADASMQMLFNTRVSLGTPLPKLPVPKGRAAAPLALAAGKPVVGDVVFGPVAKEPLAAVAVPGPRDGKPAFVLLATYDAQSLLERLDQAPLPAGWALSIVDSTGRVVARRASPDFDREARAEGSERLTAALRIAPWAAAVEIPRSLYRQPAFRAGIELALLAASATLAALAGGAFAGRRLARSIASLADSRGETAGTLRVAELEAVRARLAGLAGTNETARKALQESRDVLDSVVENVPIRVFWKDRDLRFLGGNSSFARDAGFSRRDELVGKDDFQMAWREQAETYRADDRHVIESDSPRLAIEEQQTTSDGRKVWLRTSKVPLHAADGKVAGVLGIYEDITERKRMQAAVESSERKFRSMIENASDLIVMIDAQGTILYASPSLKRMGGFTPQAVVGRSIMEFTHPEDLTSAAAALASVLHRPEAPHGAQLRWRHDDGHYVVLDSVAKNGLADPELGAIVINARDVTQRVEAEAKLREGEARLRAILDQSIAGVYVIQEGKIVYVNPRIREIFGYAPGEPFDTDPLAHVQESDRGKVLEQMQMRLDGKPHASYSIAARRRDGTEFVLGLHATRASFEGKPAIIATAQDITEKARAEEEIRRYVARLEQATKGTIDVIATIGELRDPYTHGHERRVAEIAVSIAREMGLAEEQVEGVRVAGYLHDVGKIGVPAEILAKPTRLTEAEYALVKDHAQKSYEILKGVEFPWPVAEIAWQHHERLDGSGYPQGLKGEQILIEARILAVADTVEAMASHRPYRAGLGIERALAEIEKGRGGIYDSQVVDACLRLFREKGYQLPA
ncbi:MAG TPA: PAS domain S-box protein [Burkholderiales bacterium]|nr:PAS domain S-box protein [Burkholderiales bacterium]